MLRLPRRSIGGLAIAAALFAANAFVAHADGPPATPRAACAPGDKTESGLQGRVPAEEVESGRASEGYTCNTELVARFGNTFFNGGAGGYKVYRYIDAAGHECAYYDTTLLFPLNTTTAGPNLTGVFVLDMSDPSHPRKTANLLSPAMQSPHESLSINLERGLLAAVAGYPLYLPGIVDVYDISGNCLQPQLRSSTPLGILGHEGNFSPDGNTFWVTSTGGNQVTAVDVSDPVVPKILWTSRDYNFHGINVSDDGNRLYAADLGRPGLTILDVSDVQAREPNPVVTEVTHFTWDNVSIPQNAIPVTIDDHPYIVEIDEFARGLDVGNPNAPIGAARIIDIGDEENPEVVSDIRLEVHQPENVEATAGDPGADFFLQGYAGHYCAVPQREDPGVVACSFILSGMRLFDIRDPDEPSEIAYFNGPIPKTDALGQPGTSYAMSAPAFAPERGEVWYSDGNTGFYAVGVREGVWPFPD